MLGAHAAVATVAVRRLADARRFYEELVGLEVAFEGDGHMVAYAAGAATLLVYESRFAGTNRATGVTWPVGDAVDELVRDLRARGVRFEHYDLEGTTREGDVHVAGGMRTAWFADPDGNVHAIVNA